MICEKCGHKVFDIVTHETMCDDLISDNENAQLRADLAAVEKERDELLSSELTANALTMQYEEQLKKAEIEIKKIKVRGNCKNFSTFTLNNCCLFFGSLESPDGQCDSWVFLCDKC